MVSMVDALDADMVLVEHEGAASAAPGLTEITPTRSESADSIPTLEDVSSDDDSEGSEDIVFDAGDKSGGPPKMSGPPKRSCERLGLSDNLVLPAWPARKLAPAKHDEAVDDAQAEAEVESIEEPLVAASGMQLARVLDSCARVLACVLCALLLLSPLVWSSRLFVPVHDDWQALAAQAEWLPTPAWVLSAEERSNLSFVQVQGPPGSRLEVFVTSKTDEPAPPARGHLQTKQRVLAIRLPSGATCTSWTASFYRVLAGALCASASLAWACATIALAVTQVLEPKGTPLVADRLRSWLARIAQREAVLLCLLLGLPAIMALLSYLRVLVLACGAEHGMEIREDGVALFRGVLGSTPQALFVPSALLDPVDRFASRFKLASVAFDFRQLHQQEVGFVKALIDNFNAESSRDEPAGKSCATVALLQGFVSSNLGNLIDMKRTSYSAMLTLGNVLIGKLPDPAAAKNMCHTAVSTLGKALQSQLWPL